MSTTRGSLIRARVALFAAAVPVLMRLPLPALARLLDRPPRRRRAAARSVAGEVEAVLEHRGRFVRHGCITTGVTRFFFLRRAGMPVSLCFGMGRPIDGLEGHCWVELRGEPYLESSDPRPVFAETFRIPVA